MRDDRDCGRSQTRMACTSHQTARMQLSSLVAGILALGACADTGAHLTFDAPQGPRSADSFQVILARSDAIPSIQNQRTTYGGTETQTVSYFLQRTAAGATSDKVDTVDGFTVRIAPDESVAESELIPFVLLYDGNDRIIGVGTYRAGDTPMPSPILVVRDEIDKYTLSVERVDEVSDLDDPAPGQVVRVTCPKDDGTELTSGIVWRPLGGGELRILLPEDGSDDASNRDLDLDCDGKAVKPDDSRLDCDDMRAKFHRGAEDICDGLATDCDGAQVMATDCTSTAFVCTNPQNNTVVPGVELCDDRTGQALGCHANATCSCLGDLGSCVSCIAQATAGSIQATVRPCQPAIGMLSTYGKCSVNEPCDVEVVQTTDDWKIEIAPTGTTSFGDRAYGVTDAMLIKAKHGPDSTYEQMGAATTTLSDVTLALIQKSGVILYTPVRLQVDEGALLTDCPMTPTLTCYP
jgi:hypothetical protein